ncbi:MAG TPA: transporter [Syntrophobacteraceae bacterium]|nr:transporter [Syntrophobacteraceae bacterium]
MMVPKKRNGFWLILVSLAALLFGCMKVGPDYVRPQVSLSPNWSEPRNQHVTTETAEYRAWWEVFNDPVLDRIIDRAYRENLSLKLAGVRVLEARAQLGVAVGGLFPQTQQASGYVNYNRLSERSYLGASSQGNIDLDYLQGQIGLNAQWEIDFWGKFRRAIESADAGLLASMADYDSTLVSLTADAASYYIRILTFRKRLDIARQNVATQKEALQIAQARFQGGTTSERDVEQARTLLFNTQATIPTLEAQLRQSENALSVLLALPPGNLGTVLDGAADIPVPHPLVAVGIPADLLRRRPDVRSTELQAIAQSAQIGVAKADLLPAFSLTGSFGFLSTDVGRFGLVDMFSWKALTASGGPTFQWNILNYGRITNNIRVQDAKFQGLLISYQNTVLKAQQEVEDSLTGYLRAQVNAEFLAQSADAAKRSLDLALIQYQRGAVDFTTVLVAQQALLTAQDSFASGLGNIAGNLVALYRTLGGGWQIREGQDLVSPEIREVMAKRTHWGTLLSIPAAMTESSEPASVIRPPDW